MDPFCSSGLRPPGPTGRARRVRKEIVSRDGQGWREEMRTKIAGEFENAASQEAIRSDQ